MTISFSFSPIRLSVIIACLSLGACMSVSAQPSDPAWQHVQNGSVYEVADTLGDGKLSYTIHWDSLSLDEREGAVATTISGTSYLLDCACDTSTRPVVFLFNGGPGASSSPLHFALGPHARNQADKTFPDNPNTVLRAADLVFIDPVETGFSRSASPEGQSRFLGVNGDVETVSTFIHRWLSVHGRTGAPVILAGQSYGGFRLANLLPEVSDLDVQGLVMVSPMLNAGAGASDFGSLFSFPTMAATAWRFGKSNLEAGSEAEAWEIARQFSENDLLLALEQGDLLDEPEKRRLAGKMAAMTGLSAELVYGSDLRIDTQDFLENMLADENLLVSRLNTATTQEVNPVAANPDRPAAANDPTLGLGRSNKILSADIAAYLRNLTGLDAGDEYRSLNLDANFAWNWTTSNQPGFFVDATPLLGTRYALTHGGLPQDRAELVTLPSGHSPFDEADLKHPFAEDVFKFIQEAVPASATEGAQSQ